MKKVLIVIGVLILLTNDIILFVFWRIYYMTFWSNNYVQFVRIKWKDLKLSHPLDCLGCQRTT